MQGWEGLLPGRRGTVDVMSIARSGLPPEVVGVVLLLKGKRNGKFMSASRTRSRASSSRMSCS